MLSKVDNPVQSELDPQRITFKILPWGNAVERRDWIIYPLDNLVKSFTKFFKILQQILQIKWQDLPFLKKCNKLLRCLTYLIKRYGITWSSFNNNPPLGIRKVSPGKTFTLNLTFTFSEGFDSGLTCQRLIRSSGFLDVAQLSHICQINSLLKCIKNYINN